MKKVLCIIACMLLFCAAALGCTCRRDMRPAATIAPSPTMHVTQRPIDTPAPVHTNEPQHTENPEHSPGATNGVENTTKP